MQALTPLLFSMLFPRSNSPERRNSGPTDDNDESLLTNDRRYSFHDGYILDRQSSSSSTKTRRHRSVGTSRRASSEPTLSLSSNNNANSATSINTRSTGSIAHRRANHPKSLSIDHAAFIATYPMLDGLGDTARTSDCEYYGPLISSSSPSSTKTKARKHRSQDGLPTSSRASTSSLCSLVDDDSMTCSSSASSIREPLTPTTKSPADYHSIMRVGSPAKKSSPITKDLVSFDDNSLVSCQSPQSNNFFSEGEPIGYKTSVTVESRGQRRLIAH
ncbi:hypothetical protein BGZ46_000056 [Entomortierella lignicola]|nr:hypothetical protein BGZ46_000056 [Entomortierella lignicola]